MFAGPQLVVARVNAALMRVVGVAISDERPGSSEASFTTVYDQRRKSIAAAASKKPELSRSSCRNFLQFCPLSAPVDLLILSAPARPPCCPSLSRSAYASRKEITKSSDGEMFRRFSLWYVGLITGKLSLKCWTLT